MVCLKVQSWVRYYFIIYIPLCKAIDRHSFVKFHFYADDSQLFMHFTHKKVIQSFERRIRSLDDVKMVIS